MNFNNLEQDILYATMEKIAGAEKVVTEAAKKKVPGLFKSLWRSSKGMGKNLWNSADAYFSSEAPDAGKTFMKNLLYGVGEKGNMGLHRGIDTIAKGIYNNPGTAAGLGIGAAGLGALGTGMYLANHNKQGSLRLTDNDVRLVLPFLYRE